MLGAEERHQRDAGRLVQQVDGRRAVGGAAGVVGDEPDLAALQRREAVADQDVDAGEHARRRRCRRPAGRDRTRRRSRCRWCAGCVSSASVCAADQRRRRDGRDPGPERRDVAGAVGVQAARQEDHEQLRVRIDPDRRAGEAGVAERAERHAARRGWPRSSCRRPSRGRAARGIAGGVAGVIILATVSGASTRRGAQRAAAEQHAHEPGQVAGGAEQPGVAGDAAHPPRRGVVHDAAQRLGLGRLARPGVEEAAALGRRDAADALERRLEAGVGHAERLEQVAGHVAARAARPRRAPRCGRAGRS